MCAECRYHHNQSKKSRLKSDKLYSVLDKSEKKKVFSSIKKKFREPTGELSVFKEIFNERPRLSELSGFPIPEFDVFCFHHLLSKKAFPKFRLYKQNIIFITHFEHMEYHNGTLSKDYKAILKEKAEKLKQEYYGTNQQKVPDETGVV